MSEALILAFLFFMGCIVGWGIEVIFRRFKKENVSRKWVNPGFLVGPYLPLYGFGLCGLYLLTSLENTSLIEEVTAGSKIVLFLIMAVVMTLFEYIAGLIFIKGMHVQLWDYSKEKIQHPRDHMPEIFNLLGNPGCDILFSDSSAYSECSSVAVT